MGLIYITGISGSGKSSVCEALKKLGFESHDADGEGINALHDRETGKVVEMHYSQNSRTPGWYKKYSWRTRREKVEALAKRAKDKEIFLCGVSGNDRQMFDLFSKIICLVIDENTLCHRIASRTTNDFGKVSRELDDILKWHKGYVASSWRESGAEVVDANQPLSGVVDDILKVAT